MYLKREYNMKEKQNFRKERFRTISLAIGIGLLPPIWAVVSLALGIKVGGVALICAALFVANGNKLQDLLKISVGFTISVAWGCIALYIQDILPWSKSINMFIILCFMGGIAVFIASGKLEKFIYLPSWLCGWAITMGILGETSINSWGYLPISILVSMIVGVIYAGAGVLVFGELIKKLLLYINSYR